jgi:hypothetical protein
MNPVERDAFDSDESPPKTNCFSGLSSDKRQRQTALRFSNDFNGGLPSQTVIDMIEMSTRFHLLGIKQVLDAL